jgi:hypothetical protein
MTRELFRSTFDKPTVELLLTALLVALLIFCDVAVFAHPGPQPTPAPIPEAQDAPKIPNDKWDSLEIRD